MNHTIREALNRLRSFFRKEPLDRELDAEMSSHIEMAIEDKMARGLSSEVARREALAEFGGEQQARERHRESRGLPWLDVLAQDVRFTVRTLRRERAFATMAILILGLGIGANVAVFSVVNTILLRPLPFPNAQQLVRIVEKNAKASESDRTYTADATEDFEKQNHSFQSVSGYFAFTPPDNLKLMGRAQPLPVTGILVAENFFETLGIKPVTGRLFAHREFVHNAQPVAVLSYPFWLREFHGDRGVVGKTVNLNNTAVIVAGVLPESFDFGAVFSPGSRVDLFAPYIMDDFRDDGNDLALFGRLKPGVSLSAAQRDADRLFPQLYAVHKHPEYGKPYTGQLTDLKEYVSGKLHRSLVVLWCAVGMILLIVCVNLSNLLIARAAARSREFALRGALGAGRGRLVRQQLTESLLLSFAGAIAGLGIAFAIVTYLAHQGSLALPLLNMVRIDGAALGWTVLIGVGAGIFFAFAASMRISGRNIQETLKDGGNGAVGSRGVGLRSALVIAEVALACVLLAGSGLLLRSFLRVMDVDLGFEPSHAAAISVDYDDGGKPAKRVSIWQDATRLARQIPGVEAAGITDNLPMSRNRSWGIRGKGVAYDGGNFQSVFVYIVAPGYFRAMGMRIVQGRDLDWADLANDQKVAIINETVAKKLWPGQSAVGRIAEVGGAEARVIGVVADVRETSAEEGAAWQAYLPANKQFGPEGCYLVLRSKLPVKTLAPMVMRVLRRMNPGQPATELTPIQALVDHATSPRRFFLLLVCGFAIFGLLLASLGIYGVISYSVTRETRQIGIQMAIGASQRRVLFGIIGRTAKLVSCGVGAGILGALAVSRLIASLLFGTSPNDPLTFAGIAVLLSGVALLAGYIPARSASRVDPMIALRTD